MPDFQQQQRDIATGRDIYLQWKADWETNGGSVERLMFKLYEAWGIADLQAERERSKRLEAEVRELEARIEALCNPRKDSR